MQRETRETLEVFLKTRCAI